MDFDKDPRKDAQKFNQALDETFPPADSDAEDQAVKPLPFWQRPPEPEDPADVQ